MTSIGLYAFLSTPAKINRQKIAGVDLDLADLTEGTISSADVLQEYKDNYESSVVTSDDGSTVLTKAAKWTNGDQTTADIRIDYGESGEENSKVDVVFVLDYSGSMLEPTYATIGSTTYYWPRVLLMEDIIEDCIDQLLGANSSGYDIRIAMTGFESTTKWSTSDSSGSDSGFLDDATELKSYLTSQAIGGTSYAAGLGEAINLIDGRSDTSRQPVVIFLSDGAGIEASTQAQTLRDMGVDVHPMGIYINATNTSAIDSLKAISYDENTYYFADDTSSFEDAMESLMKNTITAGTLNVTVADELSKYFKVGYAADIEVSVGTVTVDGKYIYWNLTGQAAGKVHNMIIHSNLDEEYSGRYEATNDSLITKKYTGGNLYTAITAESQPTLYRTTATVKTSAPQTGDTGTLMISVAGLALIASTVPIVMKKKKLTNR